MALLEPVLATVAGRGSIPKYVYIYILYIMYCMWMYLCIYIYVHVRINIHIVYLYFKKNIYIHVARCYRGSMLRSRKPLDDFAGFLQPVLEKKHQFLQKKP